MVNYTTIQHNVRKKLGLSLIEYCIADAIYHLSSNPLAIHAGWCYASRKWFAESFGIAKRTTFNALNTLEAASLIEKGERGLLRTTSLWYQTVIEANNKDTEGAAKQGAKSALRGAKSALDSAKIAPYNNSNSNINKNNNNSVGGGIMDSESRITTTPEASKVNEPYKPRKDPLSRTVMGWKIIGGWDPKDREWDKNQWSRTSKTAKRLLEKFRGDWVAAVNYMEAFAAAYKEKRLSFTIETMDAKFDEWRRDYGDPRPKQVEPRQEISEPRPAFNDPDAAENRSRLAGLLGVVQFGQV